MNLMNLMQLKEAWSIFKDNHPKFPLFLKAASESALNSMIEIRVTSPEGKTLTTNMKLKASDLELIEQLKSSLK